MVVRESEEEQPEVRDSSQRVKWQRSSPSMRTRERNYYRGWERRGERDGIWVTADGSLIRQIEIVVRHSLQEDNWMECAFRARPPVAPSTPWSPDPGYTPLWFHPPLVKPDFAVLLALGRIRILRGVIFLSVSEWASF